MTKVELHITGRGIITLELDEVKAPKTVANFVEYVKQGHFSGTIFHRIIKDFMIQGGGFTADMKQKPTTAQIENEAGNGLKNDKYTIAMARTNDPHSASAQYYINTKNNDFLNFQAPSGSAWGYAVFGKVVAGTEVVDALNGTKTGRKGMHDDVPVEAVVIEKAVLV